MTTDAHPLISLVATFLANTTMTSANVLLPIHLLYPFSRHPPATCDEHGEQCVVIALSTA